MTNQLAPGSVAKAILVAWTQAGVKWAPLNGVEELPVLTSDVDVSVDGSCFDLAVSLALKTADRSEYSLAQVLSYDLTRCTALVFIGAEGHFQLDLECDDLALGRLGSSRRATLKYRDTKFKEAATAMYFVRKRAYKGISDNSHRASLERALQAIHTKERAPRDLRVNKQILAELGRVVHDKSVVSLGRFHRRFRWVDTVTRPWLIPLSWVLMLQRWILRAIAPTGRLIVISGTNGKRQSEWSQELGFSLAGVFDRFTLVEMNEPTLWTRLRVVSHALVAVRRKTLFVLSVTTASHPGPNIEVDGFRHLSRNLFVKRQPMEGQRWTPPSPDSDARCKTTAAVQAGNAGI